MNNYEIGDRVALWTGDNPPLFAGIFSIADPTEFVSDLVLIAAYDEYLVKSLRSPMGWRIREGLRFQLSHTLSDKYDADTMVPGIYQPIDVIHNVISDHSETLMFMCFKQLG